MPKLSLPNPEYAFVGYLFERLLFEQVLVSNKLSGCNLDPFWIAQQFDFVLEFYQAFGLRKYHRLRAEAIKNLNLQEPWGVVIFLRNRRGQYQIFPQTLADTFEFGPEDDKNQEVGCQHMSSKQIREFKREFAKVSEEYRASMDLLVNILRENRLAPHRDHEKTANEGSEDEDGDDDSNKVDMDCLAGSLLAEEYIDKLDEVRPSLEKRMAIEQNVVAAIKSLTSMDVIVLSSFSRGINVSDFDIELLLVDPASSPASKQATKSASATPPIAKPIVLTMNELSSRLTKAGYKSVEIAFRYSDTYCDINPSYVNFLDSKNQVTCQVTTNNPLGPVVRDLMQAYADLDERLERVIYALQQITLDHGRCKKFLNNYALALMAIAYMQAEHSMPRLQSKSSSANPSVTPKSSQSASQKEAGPPLETPKQGQPSLTASTKSSSVPTSSSSSKPATETNKPATKTNKPTSKMNKRRNRHKGGVGSRVIQVTTRSGGVRKVDCRFRTEDDLWDPEDGFTGGEFLDFILAFFADEDIFQLQEINPITGTIDESTTNPIAVSTDNNVPGKIDESRRGLVVRDPFVTDRNVTWLCSGWKAVVTQHCFEKASYTLTAASEREIFSPPPEDPFSIRDHDGYPRDSDNDSDDDGYPRDSDNDSNDDGSDGSDNSGEGKIRKLGPRTRRPDVPAVYVHLMEEIMMMGFLEPLGDGRFERED